MICLEASLDDGILFAGGSSKQDLKNGEAKLFAITFDESMNQLDDIVLKMPQGESKLGVTSMRRFMDKDVLVAGTFQTIFIVEWTGTHFCLLNAVEDLHSSLISSIDLAESSVFAVCSNDNNISKVDFSAEN